jgi:hypothetical protein
VAVPADFWATTAQVIPALLLTYVVERKYTERSHLRDFQLLINIKSDGPSTYAAIDKALQKYKSINTVFVGAGYKVRFWPDVPGAAREALWSELTAAGVDYLNTDDLHGLESFLRA